MHTSFLVALALCVSAGTASANQDCRPTDSSPFPCEQTTYEKAAKSIKTSLKRLQRQYVAASLAPDAAKPNGWQELLRAQAAWEKFVTHDCNAVRLSYEGGTGANAAEISCLAAHYKARAQQLLQRPDA